MAKEKLVEVRPVRYQVTVTPDGSPPDGRDWSLYVEERAGDSWAVVRGGLCLSIGGGWDKEPPEIERTGRWLSLHRFSKTKALEAAEKLAPFMSINGETARQAYQRRVENQNTRHETNA